MKEKNGLKDGKHSYNHDSRKSILENITTIYYDKIVASTKPIWENVDRTGWHQIFEQPKSVFLHLATSRQVKWHALYWK